MLILHLRRHPLTGARTSQRTAHLRPRRAPQGAGTHAGIASVLAHHPSDSRYPLSAPSLHSCLRTKLAGFRGSTVAFSLKSDDHISRGPRGASHTTRGLPALLVLETDGKRTTVPRGSGEAHLSRRARVNQVETERPLTLLARRGRGDGRRWPRLRRSASARPPPSAPRPRRSCPAPPSRTCR